MAKADRAPQAAGVYVHLPFCSRICPYCDFAVTVGRADERRQLIEAIRREIELHAAEPTSEVDTIYFGGGTPSLIGAAELAGLVETLRRKLSVAADCRIFLEANPEDVRRQTVEAWREIGITTLSLGVQSLEAGALEFLGREHTPAEAARAVEMARMGGFETVSLDLIYARPDQRLATWRRELAAAAALAPDHISCYQLTVGASTPFGRRAARGDLTELAEPLQAELLLTSHQTLADLGYAGYEVSNFARAPRHRSRHNMKYWSGAPYLGFGPSAHSFAAAERWWNVAGSREYLRRIESDTSPVAGRELLTDGQQLLEALMLGLRTTAGVDLAALERRFGVELRSPNRRLVEGWREVGWVEAASGRLRPTPSGLVVADHLSAALCLPHQL